MNKSYAFALRIIRVYKYLITEKKEYVLSKQLLRSGTAIGALIKEGEHSITEIALKCGYNGLIQFSTAFKKFYGRPPTSLSRLP